MDWKKIEKDIGYKIAWVSLGGSRAFGLQTEKSDYDYIVYVVPGEGDNLTYNDIKKYEIPDMEGHELFIRFLSDNTRFEFFAGVWTILSFNNVIYANDIIKDFLNSNANALCNISPWNTYRIVIEKNLQYLNKGEYFRIWQSLKDACVIRNFLKLEDFQKCMYVDGDLLELYRKIHKNRYTDVTIDELREATAFLHNEELNSYFKQYRPNRELYNELMSYLEKIKLNYTM